MQAVLFDALGTLVHLAPPGPLLRRGLAERAGVEVSAEEADAAIAAEISYYRAHLQEGRDADSVALLRRRCARELRAALPARARDIDLDKLAAILLGALRFSAFPDARDAIAEVRRLPARAIVVSNWDISLEQVLARVGLTPLIDGVVTSAGAGARKPCGEIFARALELAGVEPCRAVHVGDSIEDDVAGASGAGIEPIFLSRNGAPGPPGVIVIGTLSELEGELRALRSARRRSLPPADES